MLDKSISQISKPIKEELNKFDSFLRHSLDSKVKIINTIINYMIRHKGKKIRAILCMLCAKLTGKEINNLTYLSASTVEIIHVATLLHDDVVDDAYLRRGWPTINKIWKNKLSILVGDFMFSKSLLSIAKHNSMKSINILANVSERLSEGEIFQIEKALSKQMDEKSYFKMIGDKTASLISASCLLGLSSNTDDNKLKESIERFGKDPREYEIFSNLFIDDGDGKVSGLKTQSVEWSKKNGQWRMEIITGTEKLWEADLILLAMGFTGPDKHLPDQLGIEFDEEENINTLEVPFSTTRPGVFAAGDCRRGQSLVVWAINEGRGAAMAIDKFLEN